MTKLKNRTRICRMLWQYPNISRMDLSTRLDLDKSTVTVEVNHMVEQGIIKELPEGQPGRKGGRKPIPLSINKDYGIIIGIAIQNGHYTALAVNLAGEILEAREEDLSITKENLALSVQLIYWEFRDALKKFPGILLGVGIGVGGLINQKDGTIMYSVPLQIYEPLNFVDTISKKLDIPFIVENNANCCAWGELTFHKNTELKNILFVLVEFKQALVQHDIYGGVGVGFGIVLNGKVHYGSNSSAGEFRSVMCVEKNGSQVSLSNDELGSILRDDSVFQRFASELAKNIAMLVNTLDCSHLFIGGDIEDSSYDFCHILEREIDNNWMYPYKKPLEIHYSSLGAKAVAYGAAGMFIHRLFSTNQFPVSIE
ncbi:MAG: ROK family protein [Sphaerochaetaceae bacterium]